MTPFKDAIKWEEDAEAAPFSIPASQYLELPFEKGFNFHGEHFPCLIVHYLGWIEFAKTGCEEKTSMRRRMDGFDESTDDELDNEGPMNKPEERNGYRNFEPVLSIFHAINKTFCLFDFHSCARFLLFVNVSGGAKVQFHAAIIFFPGRRLC